MDNEQEGYEQIFTTETDYHIYAILFTSAAQSCELHATRLSADMWMPLFRPWELSEGQLDERIARVPESSHRIIPCKHRRYKTEPSSGLDPVRVVAEIVSDREHQKGHCQGEEETEEDHGRSERPHSQKQGEDEPTYNQTILDRWYR